jgi:hypothetical protein
MSVQPEIDQSEMCVRCKTPLSYVGVVDFRTGGATGASLLFLGQWAEMNEQKLSLELFHCPDCRMVELKR